MKTACNTLNRLIIPTATQNAFVGFANFQNPRLYEEQSSDKFITETRYTENNY
jgi:hypothetical protein